MQNPISFFDKKLKNLNLLPEQPGVYQFLDNKKEPVYIGKAKNLRKRVKSYFSKPSTQSKKAIRLVSESAYIDITITTSELEALLLEQHLIKEKKPKFNVQFKDDKGYPWIKISISNKFPSATSFLGKRDLKDRYFGPFPSSFAVRDTLKVLQRIFKIRDCKDAFFKNRNRPCLQYEIGRCSAPCVNEIKQKDYLGEVLQAIQVLEGKADHLIEDMYLEMDKLSEIKSYEKAADFRDKISSLREIQRDQSIVGYKKDQDAIYVSHTPSLTKVGVTSVRGGWIVSHKNFTQSNPSSKETTLDSFLSSYYTKDNFCPNTILVSETLNDKSTIQKALTEFHNKEITITNKILKRNVGLMEISKSNTNFNLKRNKQSRKDLQKVFASLRDLLKLEEDIGLIESYDISHLSSDNVVAGQVTYNKLGKQKGLYRIYNISKENRGNDIASMQEVIKRRFKNKEKGTSLPSLIIIDGGTTHIKAVRKILKSLNVENICLLGISKGVRRKLEMDTVHTEFGKPLNLTKNASEFLLIQEIRDETHRFSIAKQRNRQLKNITKSNIDSIYSIGATKKKALLRYFGSFEQVQKATKKDLIKVKGIGSKTANIIFNNLH